ncbi:MAG: PAS domain S-box protein [Nitrospinae bacterium]|nr:PAS domain S-box protein [Nitrospinota bacterium]
MSWAKSPYLMQPVIILSSGSHDRRTLLDNPAQDLIRDLLRPELEEHGFFDFAVIAPDQVCLASMRNANVGEKHPLSLEKGVLEKVFGGENLIASYLASEIKTDDRPDDPVQPTTYVTGPIYDNAGVIIGALVFYVDPGQDLTRTLQSLYVGETGEVYAFNKRGKMISRSRFESQLQKTGPLSMGEGSVLAPEIRDPGGNMDDGFRPNIPRGNQPLTHMAAEATAGRSGANLEGYRNYRGIPVVGSWSWNETLGLGIAAEISKEEAYKSYEATRGLVSVMIGAITLLFLRGAYVQVQRRRAAEAFAEIVSRKEAHLNAIVGNLADGIVTADERAIIASVNPAAERIFGYGKGELAGKNIGALMPEPQGNERHELIGDRLVARQTKIAGPGREAVGKRKDGALFPLDITVTDFLSEENKRFFVAILRDITERKRMQERLKRENAYVRLLQEITDIANQDMDLEDCFVLCLKRVSDITGWPAGHVCFLANKDKLISSRFWSFKEPERFQALKEITDKTVLSRGEGLPGRVLESGQPVWIGDIHESGQPVWIGDIHDDKKFPRAKTFKELGIRSAFAFPALSKDNVVAVLEFFSDRVEEPDGEFLEVMSKIGIQLGRVMERKWASEQIRKLSDAIEQCHASVIITGVDGSIEYVNPAFSRMTGYSREEVLGKNPRILQSGLTPREVYAELWNTVLSGREWKGEFVNRKKNGEIFYEIAAVSPLKNHKGEIVSLAGFKLDITREKQLEKALIESERGFRDLASRLQALVQGTSSAVGKDFLRSLVRCLAEVFKVQYAFVSEVAGEDRKRCRTLAVWNGERIAGNFEYELADTPCGKVAQGETVFYPDEVQDLFPRDRTLFEMGAKCYLGHPLFDAAGGFLGIIALMDTKPAEASPFDEHVLRLFAARAEAEIQRLRSESLFRESEERFRLFAENFREVIWMMSPDGQKTLYVNPAYERIWGKTCQSLYEAPSTWMDSIYPEDKERIIDAFDKLRLAGGEFDHEYRIMNANGEIRWVRDQAFLVRNANGKTIKIAGIAEDITERKLEHEKVLQAHRSLIASEKLTSIGHLAAGVCHEILNPINIISLHAQLLTRRRKDDPELLKTLDTIRNEIRRTEKIARSLLSFSRKGLSEAKTISLCDELETVLELVRKGCIVDDIRVVKEFPSHRSPTIEADPDEMRQVFLNLAHNACHAMKARGGTLTVGVERTDPLNVKIRISDTGTGIKKTNLEKIFEPFFTTKPEGEGTGMGLSVCKAIVEKSGGTIRVESEEGRGTTFHIHLPSAEPAKGQGDILA